MGDGRVVNLRPPFYVRYPLFAVLGVLCTVLVFFAVQASLTHGEVVDFSPANCLGDWQNPAQAAGNPETIRGGDFTDGNSAMFTSSSEQIYCGGFLPATFTASGTIKNVSLSFVWQVVAGADASSSSEMLLPGITAVSSTDETVFVSSSSSVFSAPSSSFEISTSSSPVTGSDQGNVSTPSSSSVDQGRSDNSLQSSGVSTVPQASVPDTSGISAATSSPDQGSAPAAQSNSSTSALLSDGFLFTLRSLIFSSALADDTSDTASTIVNDSSSPSSLGSGGLPAISPDTSSSASSDTVIMMPPITATLAPITTSSSSQIFPENLGGQAPMTSSSDVTSSPPVISPPPPDKNFLSISYSTDGATWVELQRVNMDNWPNLTVSLPVTDWNELGKIQIRVEKIPTTQDPLPRVFLDGVILEAHYDVMPDLTLNNVFPLNQSSTSDTASLAGLPSLPLNLNAPNPFPDLPQVAADGTNTIVLLKQDFSANESPQAQLNVENVFAASGSVFSASSTVSVAGQTTVSQPALNTSTATTKANTGVATTTPVIIATPSVSNFKTNGTLHVVLRVQDQAGGSATSSDFTVQVIAGHPHPTSTFPGDAAGTAITIDANATYGVNVSTLPGYTPAEEGNCADSSGLLPGTSATCTITETYVSPQILPAATFTTTSTATTTSTVSMPTSTQTAATISTDAATSTTPMSTSTQVATTDGQATQTDITLASSSASSSTP